MLKMDFDSVEKVNKLAKTLKDNGLAANIEDAINMSIKMLGKELKSENFTAEEILNYKNETNN